MSKESEKVFVTHKARISGEIDSKKDSRPTKLGRTPSMTVKPSFRELRDLGLCGLHTFENMTISMSQKRGKNQRFPLIPHLRV